MAGPESDRSVPKTGDGASKTDGEKVAQEAHQAHNNMLDDILVGGKQFAETVLQGLGAGAIGHATADFLDGLDGKKDGKFNASIQMISERVPSSEQYLISTLTNEQLADIRKQKYPINSNHDKDNVIEHKEHDKKLADYLKKTYPINFKEDNLNAIDVDRETVKISRLLRQAEFNKRPEVKDK